ncbi:MAG TPA: VWA domain-containing protein, partial [Terriglobales bacterium]|nr:VWA domain-containing protein [Terriglobales bacterium]
SSLVRAFADLLPDIEIVVGCNFGCSPNRLDELCSDCSARLKETGRLPHVTRKMSIIDLPIGVTDDRVVGSINVEQTLKDGRTHFEPGLLARAHRNILYIDEVNLLPDHIVDLILDAAAYGWNVVEREGISLKHPARFILIGTMNPEEGELRPQLLDRFALSVAVQTVWNPQVRADIVKRNIEFETDQDLFTSTWSSAQTKLRSQVDNARKHIGDVYLPEQVIASISNVCGRLSVDGYRPDIVAAKVARALAALDGRKEVTQDDALQGLRLALSHRTRAGGLKPPATGSEIDKLFHEVKNIQLNPTTSQTGPSQSQSTSQQKKGFFKNAFDKMRSKREQKSTQPPGEEQRSRRRTAGFRLFMYALFAIFVVQVYFMVGLVTFLMVMTVFLLVMFVISLLKKGKGGVPSYQQTQKRLTGKTAKAIVATVFTWPTARKVQGKRVSEGDKVIEANEEKPSGQRLELDRILAKARWLGRRKGLTGRGRSVAYRNLVGGSSDISIFSSVRLAARRGMPLRVRKEDLRVNVREGRLKASMILVLDSSESMIDSVGKVRDAIRAVKKNASRMRDRIGLIVFKGEEAHVLQHPTTNFNLVAQKLEMVGLSDFTPLAAGMMSAIRMARTEQSRGYAPILVVASDGVTNVSIPRWVENATDIPDPATDALHMAKIISTNKWKIVIANMTHAVQVGPADVLLGTQLMIRMAETTRGVYVGLTHRNDQTIINDMSKSRADSGQLDSSILAAQSP